MQRPARNRTRQNRHSKPKHMHDESSREAAFEGRSESESSPLSVMFAGLLGSKASLLSSSSEIVGHFRVRDEQGSDKGCSMQDPAVHHRRFQETMELYASSSTTENIRTSTAIGTSARGAETSQKLNTLAQEGRRLKLHRQGHVDLRWTKAYTSYNKTAAQRPQHSG